MALYVTRPRRDEVRIGRGLPSGTAWSLIIRDSSNSYPRFSYLTLADNLIRDSSDFNLRFYYLMSTSNHKTGVKSRGSLGLDLYNSLSFCSL